MTSTEFVKQLKEVPLERNSYLATGVSNEFVQSKIASFHLIEKGTSNCHADPIIDLITNYDVSRLEIGMIHFHSEIKGVDSFVDIGGFEVDHLCISKSTHEIVVLSFETLEIAYRCSQNSGMFLDAIVIAARFLERCSVSEEIYNNVGASLEAAEMCSELSGGPKYLNFYKILLGCI